MFDRSWGYVKNNNVVLSTLPYFVKDPTTDEVVEMTNCTPERRKQLGWYDITFQTNYGQRANTFYEDVSKIHYDKLTDQVICTSFELKADWQNLIYETIFNKLVAYHRYDSQKEYLNLFLDKIKTYFQRTDIDHYQLISYYNILYSLLGNIFNYTVTYNAYPNIIAFEPSYGDVPFRQKEHLLHYIQDNIQSFEGKTVAVYGLTAYNNNVLLRKNNVKTIYVDNIFLHPDVPANYMSVGAILSAINNNVYYDVIEGDYDINEADILIFDGAFNTDAYEKNWQLAQEAKNKGKQVLFCSPSIWSGTNPNLQIPRETFQSLYEYEGEVVFTFK